MNLIAIFGSSRAMAIFILFVFGRSMCPFCFDLVVWYACSSKAANSLHRSYTRRVVICLPIYLGLSLHPRCSPDSRAWTLKEPGAREYRTHKKDFWDFDGKQDLSLSLALSLVLSWSTSNNREREREREREGETERSTQGSRHDLLIYPAVEHVLSNVYYTLFLLEACRFIWVHAHALVFYYIVLLFLSLFRDTFDYRETIVISFMLNLFCSHSKFYYVFFIKYINLFFFLEF